MTKRHAVAIGHLTLAAALTLGAGACRHTPRPTYETYTIGVIAHPLPLPSCRPGAPVAFARRHQATLAIDGSPSWGQLLVRVLSADTVAPPASAQVTVHHPGELRAAALQPSGLFLADSLRPESVTVEVRAIGFTNLRDTVAVRRGYADTLEVGLVRPCR